MNSSKPPLAATFAIRIAIASALSGLAYWKMGGLVVFMLSVPVWGALLAAPIVELLANYFNFARKQPYAAWQGQYYEFQGTQVRIFEIDGALWFCDRDVLHILGKNQTRPCAGPTLKLTTEKLRVPGSWRFPKPRSFGEFHTFAIRKSAN